MNKYLEYFGSAIIGAGVVLLFMWLTGRFDSCVPEIIRQLETQVKIVDTCVTVVEQRTIARPKILKGDTVYIKSVPDTVVINSVSVVKDTVCPDRLYTYSFEKAGDYYWLYEEFTVKGHDVSFEDLNTTFRLDTLLLEQTFKEVNTVVLRPEPIIKEYKTNVLKLGYQTNIGTISLHGPSVSIDFKNNVQFRAVKYLNSPGAVVGLEIPIIKF